MVRSFLGALAVLSVALLHGPAEADDVFAPAKKLGPPDLSLLCPTGSTAVPSVKKPGTMNCLTCPGGKTPTAKLLCPAIKKVRRSKPERAGTMGRFALTCNIAKGEFRNPGTRQCWKCPRGYFRDPLQKFRTNNRNLCMTAPIPVVQKPTVVESFTIKDIPKRFAEGARDLGCRGYGGGAFFKATAGACYSCPASHPKRRIGITKVSETCATAACGGKGERICNMLAGEGAPCKSGFQMNLIKGTCVPRKNVACKPIVGAVKAMRTGVDKAREATDKVPEIPGMDVIKAFVGNITGKIDEVAMGMLSKLPRAKIEADIDRIFGDPEAVRAMAAVAEEISDRRARLVDLILDVDTSCGDTTALEREMMQILLAANRAEAPGMGTILAEILGVGRAEAAVAPIFRGKSVAVTVGGLLNRNVTRLPLHSNPALEAVWQINDSGTDIEFSLYFIFGADIFHRPAPHPIAEPGLYVSFGGFGRDGCSAPYGVQLGAGKVLSGAVNHCGMVGFGFNLANVNLGDETPAINLITPENVKQTLLPAGRTPAEIDRGRAGKGGIVGFNFAFTLVGERGRSLLAP